MRRSCSGWTPAASAYSGQRETTAVIWRTIRRAVPRLRPAAATAEMSSAVKLSRLPLIGEQARQAVEAFRRALAPGPSGARPGIALNACHGGAPAPSTLKLHITSVSGMISLFCRMVAPAPGLLQ